MAVVSPAWIAVFAPLLLALLAAFWKLATMLAEVRTTIRTELSHNGGGSLKDHARAAAVDAAAARRVAQESVSTGRTALTAAETIASRQQDLEDRLKMVDKDVREIRTAMALVAVDRMREAKRLHQQDDTGS